MNLKINNKHETTYKTKDAKEKMMGAAAYAPDLIPAPTPTHTAPLPTFSLTLFLSPSALKEEDEN